MRVLVPLLLAVVLTPALALADAPAIPTLADVPPDATPGPLPRGCRGVSRSSLPAGDSIVPGTTPEGAKYELKVHREEGTTTVALFVSGRSVTSVTFSPDFATLVETLPMPDVLLTKDLNDVATQVEEELFGTTCAAADPSLALAAGGKPGWSAGKPVFPGFYAVRDLAKPKGGHRWTVYKGHVHGGTPWTTAALDAPHASTRAGFTLLPTAHGVALYDTKKDKHAWLVVTRSSDKLRFATVASARFEDDKTVVVELTDKAVSKARTLAFDVKSAKAKALPKKKAAK